MLGKYQTSRNVPFNGYALFKEAYPQYFTNSVYAPISTILAHTSYHIRGSILHLVDSQRSWEEVNTQVATIMEEELPKRLSCGVAELTWERRERRFYSNASQEKTDSLKDMPITLLHAQFTPKIISNGVVKHYLGRNEEQLTLNLLTYSDIVVHGEITYPIKDYVRLTNATGSGYLVPRKYMVENEEGKGYLTSEVTNSLDVLEDVVCTMEGPTFASRETYTITEIL